ncbi:hypothetical protein QWZ13_09790 [Reinekea marina]|uniref:DUF3024 family protein n=1 Tax=Reinekea marina TaxID=1310421 RepID=A0ABV7WUE1_9GAMM|nr:hypothetical protein [Reinekea marina]MDN3649202.1 hypothetical protein [Reinekea marina]
MSKGNEIPPLLKKQAEQSLAKFVDQAPKGKVFIATFKGARVLIQEQVPHPKNAKPLNLPYALLDYTDQGWQLLFRGTSGQWQLMPGDLPSAHIEEKLEQIRVDALGVF